MSQRWAFCCFEWCFYCDFWGNILQININNQICSKKGHYYAGKDKGYVYLNDTYVLDVNANRWNVII